MGSKTDVADLKRRALSLRAQYRDRLRELDAWETDVFRASLLYRPGGTLVDLGGGISAHNGVLAQLGMTVYVVDMLGDYWENRVNAPSCIRDEVRLLEACGVRFIQHEISQYELTSQFSEGSVDVVSTFHCIEHLHCSPRFVLESAMRVLKPGGKLIIEVPNAANARKRLALLCGRTNYQSYNDVYYSDTFLGHVREYTTGDFRQLAQNLGALSYRISGRNTIYGPRVQRIPSPIRRCLDGALQAFPSLCSALILEITKLDGPVDSLD